MPRNRHKPVEIVAKLRQADVLVSRGQRVADAVRARVAPRPPPRATCLGFSVAKDGFLTAYRWSGECRRRHAQRRRNQSDHRRFKDEPFRRPAAVRQDLVLRE